MPKILILLFLLLMIVVPSYANDEYQLREVSVEEYVQVAPIIIEQSYLDNTDIQIRRRIIEEFNLRYTNIDISKLPFDLLVNFQTGVAIGADIFLPVSDIEWFIAMIEAGLQENKTIDFNEKFMLGNFEIIPTPTDFDGNGIEEYILEVFDDFSGRNFYVLVSNTIQLVPLPITGIPSRLYGPEDGKLIIRALTDLDNDGGVEWIVEGDGYGYWGNCGDLYILDWQDGEMIERAGNLFEYCIPLTEMGRSSVNFDYSQPENIYMIEERVDGWNCQRTIRHTLNLIDNLLDETITYADSVWCSLREADLAFNEKDYETASEIFESVLPEFDGQMLQYLHARLALTYAFQNQLEKADMIITSIETEGQMGELILRLREIIQHPEMMCQVIYQFFSEINETRKDEHDNPYKWAESGYYFGTTHTDPRRIPLPIPSKAGCDYQQFIEVEPSPTPSINLDNLPPDPYDFVRYEAYSQLNKGKFGETLSAIEEIFALPEERYIYQQSELLYLRALILELSSKTDEALSQYIMIYESAPESAWGMLAKLHLEVREPE